MPSNPERANYMREYRRKNVNQPQVARLKAEARGEAVRAVINLMCGYLTCEHSACKALRQAVAAIVKDHPETSIPRK
jgi:hypothetical protein